MPKKQSELITEAIVEFIFGPQSWISGVHPLRKSQCALCEDWVTQKELAAHAMMHDREIPVIPAPTDTELDAMYAAQGQNRSEAYRYAH
jgi:hypothetical protein